MSQGTSCPEVGTRLNARVVHPDATADRLWRRFAPAIAARRSMRLYDPTTRKYVSAGPLTVKRPVLPAAVPLFSRARAGIVALDFDTKHHGHACVVADVRRLLAEEQTIIISWKFPRQRPPEALVGSGRRDARTRDPWRLAGGRDRCRGLRDPATGRRPQARLRARALGAPITCAGHARPLGAPVTHASRTSATACTPRYAAYQRAR